jgi:hypothetical protein
LIWFPPNVGKPVPVAITCVPGVALDGLRLSWAAASAAAGGEATTGVANDADMAATTNKFVMPE